MRKNLVYGFNLLRTFVWRTRYPKKLTIGSIQTFEHVRLDLIGSAKVVVGSFNQNREKLYIGVKNGDLSIGSHCFFNINSSITCMGKIKIGDYCKFGNNLVIVDHDHNFKNKISEFTTGNIIIGDNVWVGANVTILMNTEIGDNCVIGAGSVVKGKIESNSVVVNERIQKIKAI